MAINFNTANPSNLLAAFKKAIDDKKIVTWSYDTDGDFTHTPEQWKKRAWLRPRISNGVLSLTFIPSQRENTTWEVYSVYHGRFMESMMVHCHDLFSEASAPSKPTAADSITSNVA
jgi:hypothetical protein